MVADLTVDQMSLDSGGSIPSPPIICKICNQNFLSLDFLYKHIRKKHKEIKVSEYKCSKKFVSKQHRINLETINSSLKLGELPYRTIMICKMCKNEFFARSSSVKFCLECNKKVNTHVCHKCGLTFTRKIKKIYKNKVCLKCKRKVQRFITNATSIKDFSKRTISKILKRAKIKCVLCNWDKASCDIHHIIALKNGGTDNNDNLIVICPNCHRQIHTTNFYSEEFLKSKSIEKTIMNWKDFYFCSRAHKGP